MLKVLVVGGGSAGTRHMRNLLALGAHVSAYRYRGGPLPGGVETCDTLEEGLHQDPHAVVIANRTDQHLGTAQAVAQLSKPFFVEKPLSNSLRGVGALLDTVSRRQLVVEAGFMLRFHPNLRWLKDSLSLDAIGQVRYARALVGQYLPDWRPGSDHRAGYSARRAWGGGVIFDLIHELDLVTWLLGAVDDVIAFTLLEPSLGIETEAVAQIGLRMRSGALAQIHLDYIRPFYSRTLEIVGSKGTLMWDYVQGRVFGATDHGEMRLLHEVPHGFERNDMFAAHMAHFVDRVRRTDVPAASPLEDAANVLRVALAAHRSAACRTAVHPWQVDQNFVVE